MAAPVRQLYVEPIKRGFRWRQDQECRVWSERLYYSQFAAAAGSATLDITGFPGGLLIEGAFVWIPQTWIGGAVSATVISVGTTGSATAYVNAQDVFTAASLLKPGVTLVPGTPLNATTPNGAGTVRVTIATTTANTNALTQGSVDLFLRLRAMRLK